MNYTNELELSKKNISSFPGDLMTLEILKYNSQAGDIVWTVSNPDVIRLKTLDTIEDGVKAGVLLMAFSEGSCEITAMQGEKRGRCALNITSYQYDKENKLNYYLGDTHAHTAYSDGVGTPDDAFRQAKGEAFLNFFTVSDHAVYYTPRKIFKTVKSAEENSDEKFIGFPAQEADLYFEHTDDYGLVVNNGGEILVFQAEGWAKTDTWDNFFALTGENPYLMMGLPHPSDVGGETLTIWNGFNLPYVTDTRVKKYLRFIEIINSPTFEAYNLLHERIWSQALDYGYRVSPTTGSDTHSYNWGEGASWSKTVFLAPLLSRAALLDALKNNRVYATESGNVKLKFKVNGKSAGEDVEQSEWYLADFSFDVFKPANENERIIKAELFSDYGEVVDSINLNRIRGNYTLACTNPAARYFYLRLTDASGDRTWSYPIFTTNKPDEPLNPIKGSKVNRSECVILSDDSGKCKVMNGDPNDGYLSDGSSAQVVIDCKKSRIITGIGYYHHFIEIKNCAHVSQLLAKYSVEVSEDGINFTLAVKGNMRSYGGEQIIHMPNISARYIRFNALSSVGHERGTPKYINSPVAIGELSVFAL